MDFNVFADMQNPQADYSIPQLVTGKIALLDADYLKYTATYSRYKGIEANLDSGIDNVLQNIINDLMQKIGDPILFCFSGKSSETFRSHVGFEKLYKGNRKDKDDPYYYEDKYEDMGRVMEYILDKYTGVVFPDLEADDVVSALQDHENTYIVSKDKDLKQIAGHHYDWKNNQIYSISPAEAFEFLCTQLLTGDTTDNILGLKGYGPKKAEKLLADVPSGEKLNVILKEYQKVHKSLTKGTDAFVENWMLIKMREDRGTYFKEKFKNMYSLKELMLNLKNI